MPIYKEKGDVQECQNYRGIKLLSHTMKIWERIVDKRVRGEVEVAAGTRNNKSNIYSKTDGGEV